MNLYEIDKSIMNLVDPETGELSDYEAFEALQMERDAKIENIALWVKELTATTKAIKEEESNLNERRKTVERKAERLREYLSKALCGEKFQTARVVVSYRKSTSCEIENEAELVEMLENSNRLDLIKVSLPTPNKIEIARALKNGEQLPGCKLVEKSNMQIK